MECLFWDTENDTLVVTTHGIIKKTQKTPSKEIKITFATIAKVFRAMGISASFEMTGIGKVALW